MPGETEKEAGGGSHWARELGRVASVLARRVDAHGWLRPAAGRTLSRVLQRSASPAFSSPPSVSPRVKLVPPVLVVLKALKVLAVNLALLGPPGPLAPL